jgi:hypothetical protein
MRPEFKTERQEEFARLMDRMEKFDFKPADVARFLRKTPGYVSQCLVCKTDPSASMVELFRRVVEEHTAGQPKSRGENTPEELHRMLIKIRDDNPSAFAAADAAITALHDSATQYKINSSKVREASSKAEQLE